MVHNPQAHALLHSGHADPIAMRCHIGACLAATTRINTLHVHCACRRTHCWPCAGQPVPQARPSSAPASGASGSASGPGQVDVPMVHVGAPLSGGRHDSGSGATRVNWLDARMWQEVLGPSSVDMHACFRCGSCAARTPVGQWSTARCCMYGALGCAAGRMDGARLCGLVLNTHRRLRHGAQACA